MVLNPRKYDPIWKDGQVIGYKDKKTGETIRIEELEALKNQPLYEGDFIRSFDFLKQDVCSFLREYKNELVKHWDEPYELEEIGLPLAQILATLRGKEIEIIVLYVDMAGSTKVSANVNMWTNVKINRIFHMLMSQIIANFGGFVYNPVGDEVIGVFPASNFVPASDNAIQAAMTMRAGVENVLNPLFDVKKLPRIGFHIGLDIIEAAVASVGAKGIAASDSLISHQMNVAGKIAKHSSRDEILLGQNLFDVIHFDWQDKCEMLTIDEPWVEDPDRGGTYQVYKCAATWSCLD
jgi:class 3 adenylate cyclase